MNEQNQQLKQKLFERIEMDHVCPRSRLFFRTRECFVWFLWSLSVLVGALAVGISLFVFTHRQYALYEATHDDFLTFMVDVLPYLWFVIFAGMAIFAVYNLRHTKHGYRYPLSYILISSLLLSFAGGSAIQFFGLGYVMDSYLGNKVAIYTSQEKLESRLWQAPAEGRLIGRVVADETHLAAPLFIDITGRNWQLMTNELLPQDIMLLQAGQKVRVLGVMTSSTTPIFHVCGVAPWMLAKETSRKDMSREREEFLLKAYMQIKRAKERLKELESVAFASTSPTSTVLCAEIAAIRRMERQNAF